MKTIVILDGKTMGNVNFNLLNEFGEVRYYDNTLPESVEERVKDANVILTNKVVLNENNLAGSENLELICEMATGYNNIDTEYAKEKGIGVANVAGYSTTSVAQHTFATLLHIYDEIAYYDNYVKSGEYSKSHTFTNLDREFRDISGKVWGIIGLGAIGKRVARIAEAFGAEVQYYSTSGTNNSSEYKNVSFDELLKTSDIISIHAPLNEKTSGLINYDAISRMKRNAVLINMGRGPIVVEADLAKALNEHLIKAAALDVFQTEPIKEDNPLLSISNKEKLVMTPHIAWASLESRERLVNEIIKNISAFYKGEKRNRIV
ncbi:MAG: D-2-hydroxyacid dehydrogenase [Clostridiaceae bacterium]